jgi:hypothetical protein
VGDDSSKFDWTVDFIASETGVDGDDAQEGSADARLHGIEREDHDEPNDDHDATFWSPE